MSKEIRVSVDATNPGQYFGCFGLWELADRLWPDSLACFDRGEFVIQTRGSLDALIDAVVKAEFVALDPDDATSTRILLGDPFPNLVFDWWQDELAGGKDLKVWAGTMESHRIADAMRQAMRVEPEYKTSKIFEKSSVVFDPSNPAKKVEPFCFDCRRGPNAHSRDVGFSPNELKIESLAYPSVEFFALVGLQRARPARAPIKRVFHYFLWSIPAPLSLGGALAAGWIRLGHGQKFQFENWYRTSQKKHKAFLMANIVV